MKTLAIIGSTGSIGESALKVFEKNREQFKLISLAAYTNYNKLSRQYFKFKPENIFLISKYKQHNIKKLYNNKRYFFKKYIKN